MTSTLEPTRIDLPPAPKDIPCGSGSIAKRAGAFLAGLVFVVFVLSPVRAVTDSVWAVYTAHTLITHGDADLDEYRPALARARGFQIDRIDGHSYYSVPLGTSLSAVPFVAVVTMIDKEGLERSLERGGMQPVDTSAAAAIVALATLAVYAIALRATQRVGVALMVGLTFALATQAWSTASRTLWMHTPSVLCLAVVLLCAQRVPESRRATVLLGSCLALAYFVRPTNAVAALCFGIWACTLGWPTARRVAYGAAPVAGLFVVANFYLYGQMLQPYFRANRLALSGSTLEALAGNLFSPARGLLVLVPVAGLAVYGFAYKFRRRELVSLDYAVGATIVWSWVVVSCFPHWWGGWSYGPRFLTDIAPLLAWFVIPVFVAAAPRDRFRGAGTASTRLVLALFIVVGFSVFVQARGAFDPDTIGWNGAPHDIDQSPERVWDWTDPQFLR